MTADVTSALPMLEGFKEGEWVTGVEALGEEPPKLPVIAQVINTCDPLSLSYTHNALLASMIAVGDCNQQYHGLVSRALPL
jgi:hypothetical protein